MKKRFNVLAMIASVLTTLAIFAAGVISSYACAWRCYQPPTPTNLRERLAMERHDV